MYFIYYKLFIFQWERECFDETQATKEFCLTQVAESTNNLCMLFVIVYCIVQYKLHTYFNDNHMKHLKATCTFKSCIFEKK